MCVWLCSSFGYRSMGILTNQILSRVRVGVCFLATCNYIYDQAWTSELAVQKVPAGVLEG